MELGRNPAMRRSLHLKELLLPYPADQMRMWEIFPAGKQPEE
jgi:hypothetical protein